MKTERCRILLVEDDPEMLALVREHLEGEGHAVVPLGHGVEAIARLRTEDFDMVLTDLRLPDLDGMEVLRVSRETHREIPVILITAFGTIETAIQAIRQGAYDFVTKPFALAEISLLVGKAWEARRLREENRRLREEVAGRYRLHNLLGKSPAMQQVFSLIEQVAPSRSTVMVYGKSGTGKELVAKAVHFNSPRAGKAFVAVNCAAIPSELLESELFGHEKGSFTGAIAMKVGKFELANDGTLFLDEIGSMRLDLQAKILRALQEREVERVGGTRTIKIDVRVIAATNRELKQAVDQGTFREDLYYRLNVVPITLPDLKDRSEDIPLLANHFMQKFGRESNVAVREISKEAMAILLSHTWPGNVRELENVIERAVTLGHGPAILPVDLPPNLLGGADPMERALAKEASLEDLEKDYIVAILRRTKGHQIKAATILGIDRRTLYRKIRRYNIPLSRD